MVQHEDRMRDMIQIMIDKALAEHHKSMQTFVNEKFFSYEKVFTRGMSASVQKILPMMTMRLEEVSSQK